MATLLLPFRKFGFGAGLLYGLNQLFVKSGARSRLRFYEIMIQPVPDGPLVPERMLKSFEIRRLVATDPLLQSIPRSLELIQSRFRHDAVCLAAFKKEELIGYQWISVGPYEEDEVRCTFIPVPEGKAAFDYDIYIFPKFRLGLGFAALWNGANKFMRDRGIKYTCSRVSRFNTESRKAHNHFGWKRQSSAIFLSGPKRQLMIATIPPYLHLSLHSGQRPSIVIDTTAF